MKIILLIAASLAGVVLLAALVGAALPRRHEARRTAVFARSPAEVYAVIHDFAGMASWRGSLRAVEMLPPRGGRACYREISHQGAITYLVVEDRAPERLLIQIADEDLPFGGTWTFDISPESNGSRVRITERGEVKNWLFRVMARFVFGYTGTMDAYLRDLGTRFGESVRPSP